MGCSQSSISSVPVEEAAVPKNIPKSNQPNPSVGDKKESSQNSGDTSSCNTKQNLLRWKEDLSRCGDLTKAVVRIEVSPCWTKDVRIYVAFLCESETILEPISIIDE
mmetsp:Transcript_15993/g.44234  ORF Transcript_15993/g.44234 Transcript_15993/m.44234 type:complete len:107 (-) Transcript_15993:2162-2482(-)